MLKHAGLVAALTQHCAEVQRHHGTAVTLAAQDDLDTLEFDVALCLYRVAQEALTNIVRHARAGTARVELTRTERASSCRVIDDGIGFVVSEHAEAVWGCAASTSACASPAARCRVESRAGRGNQLLVRIPLARPELVEARKS